MTKKNLLTILIIAVVIVAVLVTVVVFQGGQLRTRSSWDLFGRKFPAPATPVVVEQGTPVEEIEIPIYDECLVRPDAQACAACCDENYNGAGECYRACLGR